jgi:hypothetical protein
MQAKLRFVLILAAAAPLFAQINSAGITGAITDPGGGARRGVQLAPGPYRITAAVDGFHTETRQGVLLTVGREARLDLQLSLGVVTQETLVTADSAPLKTRLAGLSGAMDNPASSPSTAG